MSLSRSRVAAAAVMCLLTAAGTGGAPAASSDDDEASASGTLQYLIEEPEGAAALQALEDRIAEFEQESGVDVEVSTLPFDPMRTVLQTQLRSGEGRDVFSYGSGPSFAGALAEAGLVQDLTEAYEERDWEVYDFAEDRVTVDGKVYGVPVSWRRSACSTTRTSSPSSASRSRRAWTS